MSAPPPARGSLGFRWRNAETDARIAGFPGRSLAPLDLSTEGYNSPVYSSRELCTKMYTAVGTNSLSE